MNIIRNEYTYPSSTGLSNIYARSWAPEISSDVKAIFQIAHGMAEHGERYENFAKYLCEQGFAVFVNDHIGHGKSVTSDEELGYFGERDGFTCFVTDAKNLTDMAKTEYPDCPVIFFGHSMGSFIARSYVEKYGNDIAGAIFCGTSGANPAAGVGIVLANFIAKVKGSHYRSEFINKIAFGSYNKKYKDVRTSHDWLSRDPEVVDKYLEDEYCGYLFTATGYRDMFSILKHVSGRQWYEGVPYILPMFLITGAMDPVGEYGKGVMQVYQELKKTGHRNVEVKVYEGLRHEILNETNKTDVYKDINDWLTKTLSE